MTSWPMSVSPIPVMQLDGLVGLERSDRAGHDAEHAAFGTRRHHAGGRRLGIEAAVARTMLGPEDTCLPVEPIDRSPDVRLAEQHGRVVDEIPRGEVVGAVDDEVVLAEDLHDVGRVEALFVKPNSR